MKKDCDICAYSYYAQDRERRLPLYKTRQHCRNPDYNSRRYTHVMFMEDRELGCCRFWSERKAS